MEIRRSLSRALLVALGLVLLASAAAAFRGNRPTQSAFRLPPPLPREWRWEPRKPIDLEFMYHQPEHPPLKLEDMYAKRRLAE